MRYTTILLFLSVQLSLLAQPTIDQTNTQLVPGTTYTVNISALQEGGAGGANASWDFSGLVPFAVATVNLVELAGSGLETAMPSATAITENALSNQSKGYEVTPTGLLYWGVLNNNNQVLMRYTDANQELVLPCTFGTTWTDPSLAEYSSGGSVLGSRTGDLTGEADGYGDLIMPFGTITNVLRVHLIENMSDVTVAGDATIQGSRFQYYKPGIAAPLVETVNNVINSPNGQNLEQLVQWLSSDITGMGPALDRAIGMNVFPQPAHGSTTVTYGAQGQVDFTLLDPSGRLVRRIGRSVVAAGIHQLQLDLTGLAAGIYMLHAITDHQEQGTVRVVVE